MSRADMLKSVQLCTVLLAVLSTEAGAADQNDFQRDGGPNTRDSFQAIGLRNLNQVYIPAPRTGESYESWLTTLRTYRDSVRSSVNRGGPLDRAIYSKRSQQWLQSAFTCHFTFMYDRSFYDPEKGDYTLDSFLRDGKQRFGGYDAILLWHAYPRIGLDPRNQLDFYRDMPGGLAGIAKLVKRAHRSSVKVFINYNPWDKGTRREPESDEEFLAELVASTGTDGIFLDTMSGDSPVLRAKIDAVRDGVCLCPEGNPDIASLALCSGSWAQWVGGEFGRAGVDNRKWIEPRHMRWQIDRWNLDHSDEIRRAFFNGSGMLVWENVFGTWNPWKPEDGDLWRRASAILHRYAALFSGDSWEPFHPITGNAPGLYCHRWSGQGMDLFTILFRPEPNPPAPTPLARASLTLLRDSDRQYFDLWSGRPLEPRPAGDQFLLETELDPKAGLACIASVSRQSVNRDFRTFLASQQKLQPSALSPQALTEPEERLSPFNPRSSPRAPLPSSPGSHPIGMLFVPGTNFHVHIEHLRRECGCYADPGTPEKARRKFSWGYPFDQKLVHDFEVKIEPFYIDEAAVSNREYESFLRASGYRPKHRENFLKHWPGGKLPTQLADHPVVCVDLDDARAYASWAGKRLPSEHEWHLAAQGTDGRTWPWGNAFDAAHPDESLVNTTGATLPVRALPAGRSPFGCYQMCGNVYEWTESLRDDGHTRYAIIRGGSYYQARGSIWYMDGGPRPCTHHAKFILMWPGLDRCATIGFRCVKDA
jgi:gamma-glutamyl hercynylcysteine S-oxide synthase